MNNQKHFTRKHYIKIAKVLNELYFSDTSADTTVDALITMFSNDNERFDAETFRTAVYRQWDTVGVSDIAELKTIADDHYTLVEGDEIHELEQEALDTFRAMRRSPNYKKELLGDMHVETYKNSTISLDIKE